MLHRSRRWKTFVLAPRAAGRCELQGGAPCSDRVEQIRLPSSPLWPGTPRRPLVHGRVRVPPVLIAETSKSRWLPPLPGPGRAGRNLVAIPAMSVFMVPCFIAIGLLLLILCNQRAIQPMRLVRGVATQNERDGVDKSGGGVRQQLNFMDNKVRLT